jgi:prolipoprotein diacylglyceryltransferase
MKTLMIIDTSHTGIFFSLTYLAAMIVAAGMTIFWGFQKGYPKSSWLLILVTGLLCFIFGEKVASYSSGEWIQVFTNFYLPETGKKTILGGIIGLFAGLILAKHALRFKSPVIDGFAVALPLAMAISRIGCLMAGCCFGTPTHLPWGIRYDESSWVYHVHQSKGLVHLHDEASLAIHPVQLYQVIGCLFIAFIVWRSRKQWKANGSLFLFSVLSYALLRFLIEFVRDPESSFVLAQVFFGMKIIQWILIGAIIPGLLILFFRESNSRSLVVSNVKYFYSGFRQVLLSIFLIILTISGRNWFTPIELSAILLFLLPVIIILNIKIYKKCSVAGFRWVIPVILVCSFSFMSQKSISDKKNSEKITFTEVGVAGMYGTYSELLQKVKVDYDCDGNKYSYSDVARQSVPFYQGGINFSYNIWRGRYTKYSFGGRLFTGNESPEQSATYSSTGQVIGISPYASLNWEWFGFTTGFSLGHMKIPVSKPESRLDNGEIITKGKCWADFIPSLTVRLGPPDKFFAEGSYASGLFPYSSPYSNFRAGVGTGFGKSNGTSAMIGLCGFSLYLRLVYPIKNKVVVEAFYTDNFSTGNEASRALSLGINYRFLDSEKDKDQLNEASMTYNTWYSRSGPFVQLKDTVTDVDGNKYPTISLGGQVWMSENLKVLHFRDGSVIPAVSGKNSRTGLQYNWHAVNNDKKLCPSGWHVPTQSEWASLISSLGGAEVAGGKLDQGFSPVGKAFQWWSSTEQDTIHAQSLYLDNETVGLIFATAAKTTGLNVRCIRNY